MNYVNIKCSTFIDSVSTVFAIEPHLDHLKCELIGRCRYPPSILKAEPFKILRMSATTGQKAVALQDGN